MAGKFVLTAEIRLRAPKNLKQVAQRIRSSLGGKTTEVKVEVKGAKKSAADVAKVERAVEKAGASAARSRGQFDALGRAISQAVVHVARYDVARRIVTGFANALGKATKDAIAFEREIIKVAQVTGQSVSSLKFLNEEVTRLAVNFGVSSSSLVKTTRILAQAGLTAKQTKQALEALAKTTLAPTFDDITSTTETSIAVMSQFGLEASKLENVLGKINKVAGSFAVEAGDLGTAIKRAGGVFKTAGGSVEELIALFTSVRSTTRETAETIATGFRTIFTRLQRPTTLKFLQKFGIQLQTLEGQFVGPYEAIRRLNAVLKDLDPRDVRYSMITEQLGGFRQVSKVIPLIQQFEKAQKAYNVALDGGSSLAKDAQTAQQGLAVQFTKVREEFTSLIRAISNDKVFRGMIDLATNMARAFIRVADSIKSIIPLLAAFGAFAFARGAGRFALGRGGGGAGGRGGAVPGVFGVNKGGRIKKYARGGLVPGSGNADTVPAMLQPGEFVIKKSAVQAHGTSRLSGMNRAARGGRIRYAGGGSVKKKAETFNAVAIRKKVVQGEVHNANVRLNAGELYNAGDEFSTTVKTSKVGIYNDDLQRRTRAGRKAFPVGKNFRNEAGAKADPINFGFGFEKFAIAKRTLQDLNKEKTNAPLDARRGTRLFEVKSGGYTKPEILEKRLHHSIALTKRKGKFPSLTSENDPPAKPGVRLSPVTVLTPRFMGPRPKSKRKRSKKASGGAIGFAAGGSVDTVPALLTPGEFVVNKESSQRIGYSKLNAMNKFSRGGPVQKFADGGPVLRFANGTTGTGVPGGATGQAAATRSAQAAQAASNKASDGLEDVGDKGKRTGRDLLAMAFVVSALSESLVTTEGMLKDMVGAGTQAILTFVLLNEVINATALSQGFDNIRGGAEGAGKSLGMLAGIGLAAAFAVSAFTDKLVAAEIKAGGQRRREAAGSARTGGQIAGAAGGAAGGLIAAGALGAAGVTVGTGGLALLVIIPAIIAALVFGGQKFDEATKAIQKADFSEAVSKLDDTFQSFSRGKVSAGFALGGVKTQARSIRGIIERDPTQRAEFVGEIGKITKETKQLALEFAKTVKTTQEFDDATKSVITEVALLGQTSFRQLRIEAHKQIKAQQLAVISQAKLNKAIEDTFITLSLQQGVSASFREMTSRVQEASRGLEVFSTLASGRLSLGKPRGIGRLLQKPEDVVDFAAFSREIDSVESALKGMGLSAEQIGNLAGPAKRTGEVLSKLPTVLLAAAKAHPTAKPGFTLIDRVLDGLGLKVGGGGADDAIASALQAALEDVGVGLAGKIQADPEGINAKIAQSLTPFIKTHAEGAKFIDASNKRLASALNQRAKLELQIAQEEGKLSDLRLQSLKILSDARGVDVSLANIKKEEVKRRKALLGPGIDGGDVEGLGSKLKSLGAEIIAADRAYELGLISFQQLQKETDGLRSQFSRVTLVLREYANIQKQIADTQKKLSDLRAQREKKVSILQDAAFGSLPDIVKLASNFERIQQLGRGGRKLTLGDPANQELLGLLRSLGNISLQAFGKISPEELKLRGLNQKEIDQRLRDKPSRTGAELAAFKTLELIRKIRGSRGVPDELAGQILGGPSRKEATLIETIRDATKKAQVAQQALIDNLKQTNTELGHTIGDQNKEFLRGLKELFSQNLANEKALKKVELSSARDRAQKSVEALKEVPTSLTGILNRRIGGDRAVAKLDFKLKDKDVSGALNADVLKSIDSNMSRLEAIQAKRVTKERLFRAGGATNIPSGRSPVVKEGGFANLRASLLLRRVRQRIMAAPKRSVGLGMALRLGRKERGALPPLPVTPGPARFLPGDSRVRLDAPAFRGRLPSRDKPFGGLLDPSRPAEGIQEVVDFRKIAKELGFADIIEKNFKGAISGKPSKTIDFLGGTLPEDVGRDIQFRILESLSEMGIEGSEIPGLAELGEELERGVGFPLKQFALVVSQIHKRIGEGIKKIDPQIKKDMREVLAGPLGEFFRRLGIDGQTAIALLARETETLKTALSGLTEFDLTKAKQEFNKTEEAASGAATELKNLNEELDELRKTNRLEREEEVKEQRKRLGIADPDPPPPPLPRQVTGTGAGGGLGQFSATRGGGVVVDRDLRLTTDDPIAHDLLERINRSLGQGRTQFSARGGMVYAQAGAGIPNWKPRGTDTVPAQTPDGQPYGLTPGERVMSVKATNTFGPQLASMERSAQSGIGLARGGVIYGQKGVSTGIKAQESEYKLVSEMKPKLQAQYKDLGYTLNQKVWMGVNSELAGKNLDVALRPEDFDFSDAKDRQRFMIAVGLMKYGLRTHKETPGRGKSDLALGGIKEFMELMARVAPGAAPPPVLLAWFKHAGLRQGSGGKVTGGVTKNPYKATDTKITRSKVEDFKKRFKDETGIDPEGIIGPAGISYFDSSGNMPGGGRMGIFQRGTPSQPTARGGRKITGGSYNPQSQVVRLGPDASYHTFFHEMMHALDMRVALASQSGQRPADFQGMLATQEKLLGNEQVREGIGLKVSDKDRPPGLSLKLMREYALQRKNKVNPRSGSSLPDRNKASELLSLPMTLLLAADRDQDGFITYKEYLDASNMQQKGYLAARGQSGEGPSGSALSIKGASNPSFRKDELLPGKEGLTTPTAQLMAALESINQSMVDPGASIDRETGKLNKSALWQMLYNYTAFAGGPSVDPQSPRGNRKDYLLNKQEQFAHFMSLTAGGKKEGGGFKGMKPQFRGVSRETRINIDKFLTNTIGGKTKYAGKSLEQVIGKERADNLRFLAAQVRESQQKAVNTGLSTGGVIYGQGGVVVKPADISQARWDQSEDAKRPKPNYGDGRVWVKRAGRWVPDKARGVAIGPNVGPSTPPPQTTTPPPTTTPTTTPPTTYRPTTQMPGSSTAPRRPSDPPEPPHRPPSGPDVQKRARRRPGGIYPHLGIANPGYYFNMLKDGGMIGLQDGGKTKTLPPVQEQLQDDLRDDLIRERRRRPGAVQEQLQDDLRDDLIRERLKIRKEKRDAEIQKKLEKLKLDLLLKEVDSFFNRRDIQENRGKQFPKFEDLPKIYPWQHGIHGPEDVPPATPTPQVSPLDDLPDASLPKKRPVAGHSAPAVPPTGVSPADIPKPQSVVQPAPSPPPTGLQKLRKAVGRSVPIRPEPLEPREAFDREGLPRGLRYLKPKPVRKRPRSAKDVIREQREARRKQQEERRKNAPRPSSRMKPKPRSGRRRGKNPALGKKMIYIDGKPVPLTKENDPERQRRQTGGMIGLQNGEEVFNNKAIKRILKQNKEDAAGFDPSKIPLLGGKHGPGHPGPTMPDPFKVPTDKLPKRRGLIFDKPKPGEKQLGPKTKKAREEDIKRRSRTRMALYDIHQILPDHPLAKKYPQGMSNKDILVESGRDPHTGDWLQKKGKEHKGLLPRGTAADLGIASQKKLASDDPRSLIRRILKLQGVSESQIDKELFKSRGRQTGGTIYAGLGSAIAKGTGKAWKFISKLFGFGAKEGVEGTTKAATKATTIAATKAATKVPRDKLIKGQVSKDLIQLPPGSEIVETPLGKQYDKLGRELLQGKQLKRELKSWRNVEEVQKGDPTGIINWPHVMHRSFQEQIDAKWLPHPDLSSEFATDLLRRKAAADARKISSTGAEGASSRVTQQIEDLAEGGWDQVTIARLVSDTSQRLGKDPGTFLSGINVTPPTGKKDWLVSAARTQIDASGRGGGPLVTIPGGLLERGKGSSIQERMRQISARKTIFEEFAHSIDAMARQAQVKGRTGYSQQLITPIHGIPEMEGTFVGANEYSMAEIGRQTLGVKGFEGGPLPKDATNPFAEIAALISSPQDSGLHQTRVGMERAEDSVKMAHAIREADAAAIRLQGVESAFRDVFPDAGPTLRPDMPLMTQTGLDLADAKRGLTLIQKGKKQVGGTLSRIEQSTGLGVSGGRPGGSKAKRLQAANESARRGAPFEKSVRYIQQPHEGYAKLLGIYEALGGDKDPFAAEMMVHILGEEKAMKFHELWDLGLKKQMMESSGKSFRELTEMFSNMAGESQGRGFQRGGLIPNYHTGGIVQRQGGGDVPAYLEGGEFVMQKKAVDNIGLDNMQALNEGGVIYAQDGRPLKERFKGVDPQTGMLRKKGPSIPGQEGMRGQGAFSRKMHTEAYLNTLSGGADTERRAGEAARTRLLDLLLHQPDTERRAGEAAAVKVLSDPHRAFKDAGEGKMTDPHRIIGGGKLKFLGKLLGISGDATRDVIGGLKEELGWAKGEQERLREDPEFWEDMIFDFMNVIGAGVAKVPGAALKAGKAGVGAVKASPAMMKAFMAFLKNAPIDKSAKGLKKAAAFLKKQRAILKTGRGILKEQGKERLKDMPRHRDLWKPSAWKQLDKVPQRAGKGLTGGFHDAMNLGRAKLADETAKSALKTGAGTAAREGVEKLTSSPGAGLGLTPAEFRGGGWADIADDPNALKELFSGDIPSYGSGATREGIEYAIEKGFFTLPEGMSIDQMQAIVAHGSERNIGSLIGNVELKDILRTGKPLSGSALETVNLLDSIRHRIPNKLHSGMDARRVDGIVSQVGKLDESAIGKTFKVNEYVSGTTSREVAQSFGFRGRSMNLKDVGPKWTDTAQYSGGLKRFYPETPPRVVLDITTTGEGIRIGNVTGYAESESLLKRGSEFEIIGIGAEVEGGGGFGRGISLKVRQKQRGGLIPSYHSGGMVRNLAGGGDVLARLQENEFVLKANAASRLKKDFGPDFLNNMNNYHNGGAVQAQAASTSINSGGGGGGGGEISVNMKDFTNALNATLQTFTQGMKQIVGPLAEAGDNLAKVDGSVITMNSKQDVNVNIPNHSKGMGDAMAELANEAVRQGINQVITRQGAAPNPTNRSSTTPIGKTQGLV